MRISDWSSDVCSSDLSRVREVLRALKPDAIVHTAAMTNVDACENDREGCKQLNIEATRYLTETAGELGAHLIHLSTDFIFDGENGPYREEDTPSPLRSEEHTSKLQSLMRHAYAVFS